MDEDKPFKCDKCMKSYKHKPNLIRHRKYECDGIAHFPCEVCGKSYTQKSNLRHHIITLHPGFKLPQHMLPRRYNKLVNFADQSHLM